MTGNLKQFFRLFLLSSFILTITGCAATLEVGNDFDETTVFQSYNTYAWYIPDAPRGEIAGPDAFDTFLDLEIKKAVESGLVKSSLRPYADNPDIFVAYDVILPENDSIPAGAIPPGVRYGYSYWYGYRYNYEFANFPTARDPSKLPPGTVIVDIIDATTNQLVWRGWAISAIDFNDSEANNINLIVASIMAQYPPVIDSSY